MFNKKLKKRIYDLERQVFVLKSNQKEIIRELDLRRSVISDSKIKKDTSPEQILLKYRDVNGLNSSSRLKNILSELLKDNKDKSLKAVFENYTLNKIKNTRGLGENMFKELEQLRVRAGLKYKI